MGLLRWLSIAVAIMLTGAPVAQTQEIPDEATRERVADWMQECLDWRFELVNFAGPEVVSSDEALRGFVALTEEHEVVSLAAIGRQYLGKCRPVSVRVRERGPGQRCGELARLLGFAHHVIRGNVESRLDPDGHLDEYLRTCVPAYAAALDGKDPAAAALEAPTSQGEQAGPSGSGPLHGSIAFSQDDDGAYAWGIAWSFDSSAGAEAEALGQCREYGGTRCAEAGWFQEACGALAIGDGNGYGTGWGATTGEAERDALAQCRAVNDDCQIEVARCAQSEEAGGRGRTDSEDMAASRAPADPSDDSCGGWEATSIATWSGGGTYTEEWGGVTKAEAEDYAQRACADYSNRSEEGALQSCDVGEATCVQLSGPQEAPAHTDAEPEQQDCRWFAYVWSHIPTGPDQGSYAVTGAGTTQTEAFDDAMGWCQASLRGVSGGSCEFADSCCVPNSGQAVFDPPCDPDPDR